MIWAVDNNIRNWLPKLQSHRGLWVYGTRENSLKSIADAYAAGYEIVEFDVRMTADGIIVLFHDDHYHNKVVRLTSYQELNSLIAITTLDELFQWFVKTKNLKLNIEIKSRDIVSCTLEKRVSDLIKKYRLEKRVLISSFNPLSLFKVRLFVPQVYRALLLTFEKKTEYNFIIQSRILNFICRPHMLNLRYQDYSDSFRLLAKKIPVVLWTVNDLTIYNKYKDEIHGIISDSITPNELKELNHVKVH